MLTSNNFDHLPAKVLTLSGYDFSQFIKNTLGENEAILLNKISVKNTLTFLATDDPLDILNYDIEDEELEKLKDQLCFKLKNQKLLIKPGVVSGFRTLKTALQKRLNEQLTKSKKKQSHLHQLFDTNLSTLSSLTTTATIATQQAAAAGLEATAGPQTSQTKSTSKHLSTSEHKEYVLRLIKKWCLENKENLNLEIFNLEDNIDFTLNIDLDVNGDVTATIKCKCDKTISLGRNDAKIQMSNFYKHLLSKGCGHMNNIRKAARSLASTHHQQSTTDKPPSVAPIPSTPTCPHAEQSPLTQTPNVLLVGKQASSNIASSISITQTSGNAKRRITSQSQQPSKRSRL